MNSIERGILLRCLDLIYGQLLTGSPEAGLQSIETLVFLIRYAGKADAPHSTLGDEVRVVQAVFRMYQPDAVFPVDLSAADPHSSCPRNSVVYEICQHGMELMHNGCHLKKLCLFTAGSHLSYAFLDDHDNLYRGTIYETDGDHPSLP